MRQTFRLALTAALGLGMTLPAHAAPPPAYGGSDREGVRPAPPPAYGDPRPTPPSGRDEQPAGPVEMAKRTAYGALERFEELDADLMRAMDPMERDGIERRMMETMGDALEAIHRNISPRQGPEAEQIYRLVEPAYKKAWLQRYEWKQELRPERKRQRLRALNLHLRQSLRDVRSAGGSW
jgi:hypothetical protein